MGRATVKDVAARAGVSPKTVSNVMNGTFPVAPATRERVEQAMTELDYVPNFSARGLRNGRTGMIALALPELNTAYSAELAHHFVHQARAPGWAIQVEETRGGPAPEHQLMLKGARPAGRRADPESGLVGDLRHPTGCGAAAGRGHRRGRPADRRPRLDRQRGSVRRRSRAPGRPRSTPDRRGRVDGVRERPASRGYIVVASPRRRSMS